MLSQQRKRCIRYGSLFGIDLLQCHRIPEDSNGIQVAFALLLVPSQQSRSRPTAGLCCTWLSAWTVSPGIAMNSIVAFRKTIMKATRRRICIQPSCALGVFSKVADPKSTQRKSISHSFENKVPYPEKIVGQHPHRLAQKGLPPKLAISVLDVLVCDGLCMWVCANQEGLHACVCSLYLMYAMCVWSTNVRQVL